MNECLLKILKKTPPPPEEQKKKMHLLLAPGGCAPRWWMLETDVFFVQAARTVGLEATHIFAGGGISAGTRLAGLL